MSTKVERTAVIDELEKAFSNASGIYVTNNNRINVEKVTKLRVDLRDSGIQFIVVKNTLAKAALARCGKDSLSPYLKGPTAVAVAKNDPTVPAKIIKDFQKDNKDLLELKAAYVEGSLFNGPDALRLAELPSREVLLSQLLGCLKAPIGNFAGALNGILTKFVGVLEAVKEKKSAE